LSFTFFTLTYSPVPFFTAPDAPLDLPAYLAACSAISNATEGKIFPPVMSARISTRKTASVK
jgi:hypothetical protein